MTKNCTDCLSILTLLNQLRDELKVGTRDLKLCGQGAKFLHARHTTEGVETCRVVVRRQVAKWWNDPKMREYLVLQTLFRESNFDRYASNSGPLQLTVREMDNKTAGDAAADVRKRIRYIREINRQRADFNLEPFPEPEDPDGR